MGEAMKPQRTKPAGTMLRMTGKNGPQRMRSKGGRWSDAAEALFLDRLAASCNVTLSAEAVGFSPEAIYRRRRLDPGFAERWQAALEQGYARIEIMLVDAATDALAGLKLDPASPIPKMTVAEALAVLQLHRAAVKGDGPRPRWRARTRSLDEVKDSILAKLAAIEASRGQG